MIFIKFVFKFSVIVILFGVINLLDVVNFILFWILYFFNMLDIIGRVVNSGKLILFCNFWNVVLVLFLLLLIVIKFGYLFSFIIVCISVLIFEILFIIILNFIGFWFNCCNWLMKWIKFLVLWINL